jgi:hypothetical protein
MIHIEPRVNQVPEQDFLIRIWPIAGPECPLWINRGHSADSSSKAALGGQSGLVTDVSKWLDDGR